MQPPNFRDAVVWVVSPTRVFGELVLVGVGSGHRSRWHAQLGENFADGGRTHQSADCGGVGVFLSQLRPGQTRLRLPLPHGGPVFPRFLLPVKTSLLCDIRDHENLH